MAAIYRVCVGLPVFMAHRDEVFIMWKHSVSDISFCFHVEYLVFIVKYVLLINIYFICVERCPIRINFIRRNPTMGAYYGFISPRQVARHWTLWIKLSRWFHPNHFLDTFPNCWIYWVVLKPDFINIRPNGQIHPVKMCCILFFWYFCNTNIFII